MTQPLTKKERLEFQRGQEVKWFEHYSKMIARFTRLQENAQARINEIDEQLKEGAV